MNVQQQIEQFLKRGNVAISQLFFHHYRALGIVDAEAMLLLQLLAFAGEGIGFPTPAQLSARTSAAERDVTAALHSLMQRGLLAIDSSQDADGRLSESFSLDRLWERLAELEVQRLSCAQETAQKEEEGGVYRVFEREFGRLLSPLECEQIAMWLDKDGHSVELIRAALKEAVLAQKLHFRYIDRILFEWSKKNIVTVRQVEQHAAQFRQATAPRQPEMPEPATGHVVAFYNWLDERE